MWFPEGYTSPAAFACPGLRQAGRRAWLGGEGSPGLSEHPSFSARLRKSPVNSEKQAVLHAGHPSPVPRLMFPFPTGGGDSLARLFAP